MDWLRTLNRRVIALFVVNPSAGSSLAYMDGIRAVAVVLILAVHAWGFSGGPGMTLVIPFTNRVLDLTRIMVYTQVGVDLFFVLSGYLLAQHWIRADLQGKPRPSVRAYLRQRFFRIAPAYYATIFLTLLFFVPKFIAPETVYSAHGAFGLLAHATFTQYYFPISAGSWGVLGQLWTLTVEVSFYLILPVLVLFFLRYRWLVSFPVIVIVTFGWLYLSKNALGPLVRLLLEQFSPAGMAPEPIRWILSKQLPGQLIHFALGMILANLFVRAQLGMAREGALRVITHPWAGKAYFVVGVAATLAGMQWVSTVASRYGYAYAKLVTEPGARVAYYLAEVPFAFSFTLIIAGVVFGGPWLQAAFGFTPLRLIGILGYSIYLWHVPVLYLFSAFPSIAALPPPQRFAVLLPAAAAILLVLSAGFYLAVEKPFILFARRRPAIVKAGATEVRPELVAAATGVIASPATPAD